MRRSKLVVYAIVAVLIGVLIWMRRRRHNPEDGKPRQTLALEASRLQRGERGDVTVRATKHFVVGKSDTVATSPITSFSVKLALVDAKGNETPLKPNDPWSKDGTARSTRVTLPEVPDGDYILRAKVHSSVGDDSVDLSLGLYAPARIHVITDRPLYEPGNQMKFRAVVLRARDLAPLDGRPGTWIVSDPTGEVLLEEKSPAGPWGVVAGSFPLDKEAPEGQWHVRWVSADASDDVAVTVKPFTLPRFHVEVTADKPFYRTGDKPSLSGAVIYSSGAPVANAAVQLTWTSSGDWPPPTEWMDKLLPKKATTGPNGRFKLTLPEVPTDLIGQATLSAEVAAVDPAGDRVEGGASVLLSHDAIQVSAVTELAEGLIESFNNRLFLRVASADGHVLRGAKLKIKRAWLPKDPGLDADTDEDGVARVQLDPGAPVNVVVPPRPVRQPPRPPLVSHGEVDDLLGEEASLADQVAFDNWLAPLGACAKWVDGESASVELGLEIDGGGRVVTAVADGEALGRCVAGIARGRTLPARVPRMYKVSFQFTDPDLPKLEPELEAVMETPEGLQERIGEAARGARDCLPGRLGPGDNAAALPMALRWRTHAGKKDVELAWIADPKGGTAAAALRCAQTRIGKIALEDEVDEDGLGLVRFTLDVPEREKQEHPQATVMLGYELDVSALVDGKDAGTTTLRMPPGVVPPLRLRATPVLAKAGDEITAELVRGPDFQGELPKKLMLTYLKGHVEADVDPDTHLAKIKLDSSVDGFCEISGGGVRALVFVRPQADLSVTVTPGAERYAPGQQAELAVKTLGQRPGRSGRGRSVRRGREPGPAGDAAGPGRHGPGQADHPDDLGRPGLRLARRAGPGARPHPRRERGHGDHPARRLRADAAPARRRGVGPGREPVRPGCRADRPLLPGARRAARAGAQLGGLGGQGREDASGDHGAALAPGPGRGREEGPARR